LALITDRVRDDLTKTMADYSERRVSELARGDLDGYVLKAGSPSCGLDIPVHGSADRGRGVFAAALTSGMPDMPIIEERALADEASRQLFVDRVRAHFRRRRPPT